MASSIEYTSKTNNTAAISSPTTGDTVVASNTSRRAFIIQNLGTNALYVRFLAGATTSLFNVVLKAGSVNDDGTGGSISSTNPCYTGDISVAGTSPRLAITEF